VPEPGTGTEPLLSLDLRNPHRHLVGARFHFHPVTSSFRFRLPAWTPGSYLIRDYVRLLEGLEAWQGDRRLRLKGAAPEGWSLDLTAPDPVELRYRILATELTVRTSHLNGDHGFLALAGVALQVEGLRWSSHQLELMLPEGWEAFVPLPGDGHGRWRADSFDQLVDTPVEVGPHPCHAFTVAGVLHRWVSWGGDLPGSDAAWLEDVTKVCLACCRLMDQPAPPADHYLFILHLGEKGYGGLEHDSSAVLQFSRRVLMEADGRRRLLHLVAHEYFHQWNVRRLRPADITPIDYSRSVAVPTLWFAEGVTSYLDQLLPHAAGLSSEAEVLEELEKDLSRYLLTPGRRIQSLRQSSEEAWVKLYRQDAHSTDNQISYYLKGAVVALVLDLHLRRSGSCLGLVLRDLWRSHGRWGRGYSESDLIEAFTVHSPDLSTLLPHWLESTDDPALGDYLADVGLQLIPELADHDDLGITLENLPWGGVGLKRVSRDGASQRAGLQVGDELLAVNDQRLFKVEDCDRLLAKAGSSAVNGYQLLICRDGMVRSFAVTADPPATRCWRLRPDASADSHPTRERRRRWLSLIP
jgi:predicted metalloprotease with PDZ domain